jgi:hypothetical protein
MLANLKNLFKRMFNPEGRDQVADPDSTIAFLLNSQALEIVGINDETGQLLYEFTPLIREVMPELYEDHCQYVYERTLELWEKGLVDMDFLADEPRVSMNEAGYLALEQRSSTADDLHFLRELDRIIANNAQ